MARISDEVLLNPGREALTGFSQGIKSDSIDPMTMELVYMRASQINGCSRCLAGHWKHALSIGMRVDKLSQIDVWRECEWFSPRERAALEWTEALTKTSQHHIEDAMYDAVREHFSEDEMVDLTWSIISINSWNRINIAFATAPRKFEFPNEQF